MSTEHLKTIIKHLLNKVQQLELERVKAKEDAFQNTLAGRAELYRWSDLDFQIASDSCYKKFEQQRKEVTDEHDKMLKLLIIN